MLLSLSPPASDQVALHVLHPAAMAQTARRGASHDGAMAVVMMEGAPHKRGERGRDERSEDGQRREKRDGQRQRDGGDEAKSSSSSRWTADGRCKRAATTGIAAMKSHTKHQLTEQTSSLEVSTVEKSSSSDKSESSGWETQPRKEDRL